MTRQQQDKHLFLALRIFTIDYVDWMKNIIMQSIYFNLSNKWLFERERELNCKKYHDDDDNDNRLLGTLLGKCT